MWNRTFLMIGLFALTCSLPAEGAKKRMKKETVAAPVMPYGVQPPQNWQYITDPSQLPTKVLCIFIGHSDGQFAPSLNIAREPTKLTLAEYTALAKRYHETQESSIVQNMGCIETCTGTAELLQIDQQTSFGPVRFLQGAIVREGTAYVITATCLQKDYAHFYPEFLTAIRTFNINNPEVPQ